MISRFRWRVSTICSHIIIYCNSIQSCNKLYKVLQQYNLDVDVVHSENNNRDALNKFIDGNLRIIINCNFINEGVDIKCCDTVIFYEKRRSSTQITQCIGRTQRIYPGKIHGNIVLLSDDENKNNTFNYIKDLYDYDKTIINNDNIYFVNDNKYYNKDNNIQENDIDDVIDDENFISFYNELKTAVIEGLFKKIILCKEFYNEFHRLPKDKETYKDWNIAGFIKGLKKGYNKDLKSDIETIFNCKIEFNNKKSSEELIQLCKEFYSEFNRLPKKNEKYNNWNIGRFIHTLKYSKNKDLKSTIEIIFNCKIKVSKKRNKKSSEELIQLCKEFYSEFNRLPKQKEIYKDWKIGEFIHTLKKGFNKDLKPAVESIFNCNIEVSKKI